MRYHKTIFDIDGTLWDATKTMAKGWTKGLKAIGIETEITAEQIQSVCGNPFEENVKILLPQYRERYKEIIDNLQEGYRKEELEKSGGNLYPYVTSGIELLSRNMEVDIVSNCSYWYLQAFLTHSKLSDFLTISKCFGASKMTKAQMINSITGEKKSGAVYIGDTLGDYKASQEAGVDFVHANFGFGIIHDQNIIQFPSFKEIVEYLMK